MKQGCVQIWGSLTYTKTENFQMYLKHIIFAKRPDNSDKCFHPHTHSFKPVMYAVAQPQASLLHTLFCDPVNHSSSYFGANSKYSWSWKPDFQYQKKWQYIWIFDKFGSWPLGQFFSYLSVLMEMASLQLFRGIGLRDWTWRIREFKQFQQVLF